MSLLLQQKKIIEKLVAENAQLKSNQKEIDQDIKKVVKTVSQMWEDLGLDSNSFKDASSFKIMTTVMSKLRGNTLKNLTGTFHEILPVLEKYKNITLDD